MSSGSTIACAGTSAPRIAAFLAGPVRSLLTPAVHRTILALFWQGVGGARVLFARLYDVHALDAVRYRRLLCVLRRLSEGGAGEWSAPRTAGNAFLPNASALLRCRFAVGTQLAQFAYMVQSLQRQLATLRACFERMEHYERTVAAAPFDWILRTRTDTAFLTPAAPHCGLGPAVQHARSFAKGEGVHHMFADHAAVVPRTHARTFFVAVGERLAACSSHAERMPPAYSEPESFIHHTLAALGTPSTSALWLAPVVVSTDGRMAKWCGRYLKLGVTEVRALGATQAACAHALLAPDGRWADVAAHSAPASGAQRLPLAAAELRRDACAAAVPPLATRAPKASGAPCSWTNGCCARHPRMDVCTSSKPMRSSSGQETPRHGGADRALRERVV